MYTFYTEDGWAYQVYCLESKACVFEETQELATEAMHKMIAERKEDGD